MDAPSTLEAIKWTWSFQDWARTQLLSSCERLDYESLREPGAIAGGLKGGSIYEMLAHIAGADWIWLQRWQGVEKAPLPSGSDYEDLLALATSWEETAKQRRAFLDGLDEGALLGEVVYLSVARGTTENVPLWKTLLHASNHATHHRADICTALTARGVSPESVDLIDFIRAGEPS